jgi:hypothetical protein
VTDDAKLKGETAASQRRQKPLKMEDEKSTPLETVSRQPVKTQQSEKTSVL